MSSTTKQIFIDASSLSSSSCILRWWLTVFEGYRESETAISMLFGTAFHLFRNTYHKNGNNVADAIKVALEKLEQSPNKFIGRNKEHLNSAMYLATVCTAYHNYWQSLEDCDIAMSPDGKPMTEVKFALPYMRTRNDYEIILCGTIDEIVFNRVAQFYCIKDYKTSSAWDKQDYFEDYRMSTQLLFYTYILQRYAQFDDIPDNFIKAFSTKGQIGCYIDGIFLGTGGKSVSFERSEVFFPSQEQVAEFGQLLDRQIKRLVEIVEAEEDRSKFLLREGMVNGACKGMWGRCKYWSSCTASRPEDRQLILDGKFEKRQYEPLKFGE